ncbi:putative protein OS=Tsukamurella paurometabola (strain ATCC 8368 / DSM / CCUG 35730 /CIP 100753 / JCM 10117 / KCTC 9821 / NBRC 16120 / NCIMB 702349/ NCTC 13040) OX=521096 GN=Tpau_0261 PE=4 SV=1 [Tsukamurella paurometabola]|uniref:Uncharacterized protein n=1 Tax=Tsukamurella paurometabola (strain ATCC 8368 / DSM 20162 / CCUG 35730 / CIP 100753 / JCM 10117 / KCTC 9821 / NBRC 16120 / NCIMB 702349 / NCTC 13040) TaxID=521096 RepID=D5UQS8_TSUPD|nr:hypothetical protein [Tsukamurella paurometabola]ADG76911.1 hypothetical protein Tpau_0261 [Tsukamurella paurometabola DSM 20162]SUP42171.1 Uncharacterised protein [Tsukamurella paurometabola]
MGTKQSTKKGPSYAEINEKLVRKAIVDNRGELARLDSTTAIREWFDAWVATVDTEPQFVWKLFLRELNKGVGVNSAELWAKEQAEHRAQVAEAARVAPLLRVCTAGFVGETPDGETVASWAICNAQADQSSRAYGEINPDKQKSYDPEDPNSADMVAAYKAVALLADAVGYLGGEAGVIRAQLVISNPNIDTDRLVSMALKDSVSLTVEHHEEADNPAVEVCETEVGERHWKDLAPRDFVIEGEQGQ